MDLTPARRRLRGLLTTLATLFIALGGLVPFIGDGEFLPAVRASGLAPIEAAPEPIECRTGPSDCGLGRSAVVAMPFDWRVLDYRIVIGEPPDDWFAGRTSHTERTVELFVRDDSDLPALQQTLAHELAHAVHERCPDLLDRWRDARGLPDDVPEHIDPPHEYDSVAEDFAEAFAQHHGFGTSRSTVGTQVTDEWLAAHGDLLDTDCGT